MSKLRGMYVWKKRNERGLPFPFDSCSNVDIADVAVACRYVVSTDCYVFRVRFGGGKLDGFITCPRQVLEMMCSFRFDDTRKKIWTSPNEYFLSTEWIGEEEIEKIEKDAINLDDDTYLSVSLIQYFYKVSLSELNKVQRQWHRFKLGRVKSVYRELERKDFDSWHKRGRKKGVIEDFERIKENVDNYDRIVKSCIEKDRYEIFYELKKDVAKLSGTGRVSEKAVREEFTKLREEWKRNR